MGDERLLDLPTRSARPPQFDELDRKLLNALQRSCSRSPAELADALGINRRTCYRRLERLRAQNVILREVAIVDQRQSPWPLSVIIEVMMERLTANVRLDFERAMGRLPQVMSFYAVSGESDYLLIVALSDVEDYYQFVNEHLVDNPAVKHFKSSFALRTMKLTTEIPF
jgi:DNA-binding Lrp family transcriptional regulator